MEVCERLTLTWRGPKSITRVAHLLPHVRVLDLTIQGPIGFKFFDMLERLETLYIQIDRVESMSLDEEGYLVNMNRLITLEIIHSRGEACYIPIRVDYVADTRRVVDGVCIGCRVVHRVM